MTTDGHSAALHRLLTELATRIEVETVDRVWLFPPRHVAARETGLAVLTLRPADEPRGPRRVMTLRYEIRGAGAAAAHSHELAEQGTAPAASVQRVIDGVLHRLGDEAQDPAVHEVDGDPARWAELLDSLAPPAVDPDTRE